MTLICNAPGTVNLDRMSGEVLKIIILGDIMEKIDSSKRIAWIDNLKAFAIFLVVLGHTGLEGESQVVAMIRTWIYEFHMPLFFLLGGISFSILQKKGKNNVNKQILNIMLVFIIQSVFYILLNMLMHNFINIQTTVETNFRNLYTFFIWPVGEFWYLQTLVIIYFIELLINTYIKDNRVRILIVMILSIVGMMTSFGILSGALYELLFFECGRQILYVKKFPLVISSIGVALSFVVPFVAIEDIVVKKLFTVIIAFTMSIFFVCIFSKYFDKKLKKITLIGNNCLWIYLFHPYFTCVSRNICNKIIPQLPEVSMVIVTIIGVVGPLIIMYLFTLIKIDRVVVKPISYFK